MNKFFKFPCIAFAAIAMTFASCSDNDGDEPDINPTDVAFVKNVFPLGLPISINDGAFVVNDKGQLTKITDTDRDGDVIFEYGDLSRADKFQVHMSVYDTSDNDIYKDYYIQLNEKGFATYVEESSDGELYCKYHFSYNNDDQLAYIKVVDVDNGKDELDVEYRLTYSNGDLTKTEEIWDGESSAYTYVYTNSSHPQPVVNKGCIMLYAEEDCFEIDMDELKWAFYAGLLGKATKNLPMGYVDEDNEGEEFVWELNSSQLPVKFYADGDTSYPDVVIRWK